MGPLPRLSRRFGNVIDFAGLYNEAIYQDIATNFTLICCKNYIVTNEENVTTLKRNLFLLQTSGQRILTIWKRRDRTGYPNFLCLSPGLSWSSSSGKGRSSSLGSTSFSAIWFLKVIVVLFTSLEIRPYSAFVPRKQVGITLSRELVSSFDIVQLIVT